MRHTPRPPGPSRPGPSRPERAAALLIGLLTLYRLAPAPARAAAAEGQSIAYRVTSTIRTIRFPLPGDSGSVALSPDTSVVVNGKRPSGPWRVTLERGEAAMTVPQGSRASGSWLSGLTSVIQVGYGTSVFWRRSDGSEGGQLANGQALLGRLAPPTGGVTPTTPPQLPPPTTMLSGQQFTVIDESRVAFADAHATTPAWMTGLASASETAKGPGLVRLPISVPPTGKREKVDADVRLRPLTIGTATLALPIDSALKNTEKLTKYRERLLLSVPGKGMGGPAVYLDLTPGEPGRVHNMLWSGGRGYVKFHLLPGWKVTMAPGTLLELDAPETVVPGQFAPTPHVKLHRGAILAEGEQIEVAPKGLPGLPAIDGITVSGEAAPVVGNRAVVFAAQPDPLIPAAQVLAEARDLFSTARNAADGGSGAAGSLTLLAQLPGSPKALAHYVPIQTTLPGKEQALDLTVLGSPPPERDDVTVKALEVDLVDLISGPIPVALVIPASVVSEPGADPEDLQVLMVPANTDSSRHLHDVFERWRELAGLRPQEPVQEQDTHLRYIAVVVIGMVLLLVISGVGGKILNLAQRLFGIVRKRCPRCDMILDHIAVTEVGTREDPDPVFALLDFDNLTDVNKQTKSRATVFDWFRGRAKRIADAYRFRVRADWCQRCMQGSFTSEVLNHGFVMDESTTEYTGSDTHELLVSLRKPPPAAAAPAKPKDADE